MKHVEPHKDKIKFHCPHCGNFVKTAAIIGHKHMHSTNPRDEILKAISIRVCESCEQPIIWLHAKMIYPVTTIIVEKVDMSPQAFSMSHAVVAPGKKGRRTKNEQQSNRSSRPESKTE